MMEFSPTTNQAPAHMGNSYFPPVSVQTPEMYLESAWHNKQLEADPFGERRLLRRSRVASFTALSELALLVTANFGRPYDARKARRELADRQTARNMGAALRLSNQYRV